MPQHPDYTTASVTHMAKASLDRLAAYATGLLGRRVTASEALQLLDQVIYQLGCDEGQAAVTSRFLAAAEAHREAVASTPVTTVAAPVATVSAYTAEQRRTMAVKAEWARKPQLVDLGTKLGLGTKSALSAYRVEALRHKVREVLGA